MNLTVFVVFDEKKVKKEERRTRRRNEEETRERERERESKIKRRRRKLFPLNMKLNFLLKPPEKLPPKEPL